MNSIEISKIARIKYLKMVYEAKASHIGSTLSIIDILSVLYCDVLQIFPKSVANSDRDRFILSKGHACVWLYTILGIKFPPHNKELKTYGKNNSIFMNHISHKVPGVEFSTGSLGHGLPFGVGKVLTAKKNNQSWRTF